MNDYTNQDLNSPCKGYNSVSIANLIKEKEDLTKLLRQERINNEEQKKYIKLLKDTIESNLFRSGFAEILTSSKEYEKFKEYNKDENITLADFLVDFIKFKEESNTNFKIEQNNKNEENYINEQKLNNKIKVLEKENFDLKSQIIENNNRYESLKNKYNNLLIDYDKLSSSINITNNKINNSINNQNIARNEFTKLKQDHVFLENNYVQCKTQNDFLKASLENLQKEYDILLDNNNEKQQLDIELDQLQKCNNDLIVSLKNSLKQNDELNQYNKNISEKVENLIKQLKEKVNNEELLIKENTKYKNDINELQLKLVQFNDLSKNYSDIKAQYMDLQNNINEINEEKNNLYDKVKNMEDTIQAINNECQTSIIKLQKYNINNLQSFDINKYCQYSSDEIIRLQKENKDLNQAIKELNIKCFDTAQENQNNFAERKNLEQILIKLSQDYDKSTKENKLLIKELDYYKLSNQQFKQAIDDYAEELNKKNVLLNDIKYKNSEIETNNNKLNNDKEFLLSILTRFSKMFSNSNIYNILNEAFSKNQENDTERQNQIFQELLMEISRCEDYTKLIKENELQSNYLNKKLNQEVQNLSLNNFIRNNDYSPYPLDNSKYDVNSNNTLLNNNYSWLSNKNKE